jgi:hypothetical protein
MIIVNRFQIDEFKIIQQKHDIKVNKQDVGEYYDKFVVENILS